MSILIAALLTTPPASRLGHARVFFNKYNDGQPTPRPATRTCDSHGQ